MLFRQNKMAKYRLTVTVEYEENQDIANSTKNSMRTLYVNKCENIRFSTGVTSIG